MLGSYVHGLFDAPAALAALLSWAGADELEKVDLAVRRQTDLDRLADAIEAHVDMAKLAAAAGWQIL